MDAATEELVRSGIGKEAKKIGDQAPDFELPDVSGAAVRLSDLLARGPVVLTFYRGTW
jgi:peroxiredoxin